MSLLRHLVCSELGRFRGTQTPSVIPRVLPAQQGRAVLLGSVHKLKERAVISIILGFTTGGKTYEEPHAGAQARCAEAVHRRHMRPEAGGKALERLRSHSAGEVALKELGTGPGRGDSSQFVVKVSRKYSCPNWTQTGGQLEGCTVTPR